VAHDTATVAVPPRERDVRRVAAAWGVAAALGGAPSTAFALATGRDPLEAARAAGTLLPGRRGRAGGLAPGLAAHATVSAIWTVVLAAVLPRRGAGAGAVMGALAGAGIAAVDLGVLARRLPAVRALPQVPQWADHLAFGALAGAVLGRGRAGSERGRP